MQYAQILPGWWVGMVGLYVIVKESKSGKYGVTTEGWVDYLSVPAEYLRPVSEEEYLVASIMLS